MIDTIWDELATNPKELIAYKLSTANPAPSRFERKLCGEGGGMKRVSLKGVAIGNIVDLVSSCIVGFLVAFYVLMSSAAFVKDIDAANQFVLASGVFWFWSVILGSLGSVLGGYVAARIARHDDVLNGALSSILCVGVNVYGLVSGGAVGHDALYLGSLPLSPALTAFGGYLSARQRARQR